MEIASYHHDHYDRGFKAFALLYQSFLEYMNLFTQGAKLLYLLSRLATSGTSQKSRHCLIFTSLGMTLPDIALSFM
jgi:hypothetical protein